MGEAQVLGAAAQNGDGQVARAVSGGVVAAADLGDAVGVGHLAHRHAADGDQFLGGVAPAGDEAGLLVHGDAGKLSLGVGHVLKLVLHRVSVFPYHRNLFIGVRHPSAGSGVLESIGNLHHLFGGGVRRLGAVVIGRHFLAVRVVVLGHRPLSGETDGHQLVAENGVARLLPGGDYLVVRIAVHADAHKAVDAQVVVGEVAVRFKAEVTQPGQGEGGELAHVGVRAVKVVGHVLVAHEEEAVAVQHHVGGIAGDGVVAGAHVDVHAAHIGAVANLGGVLAADGLGAVGAAGHCGVDGGFKHGTGGLIALGVHVCHIVADHVQVLHMGLQARDGRVHRTSHD